LDFVGPHASATRTISKPLTELEARRAKKEDESKWRPGRRVKKPETRFLKAFRQ
jgi:hypothetical protein